MKVILLQDIKKLGEKGKIIETAEGYGRNYLIPRGLAKEATLQNVNQAKQDLAVAKHACESRGKREIVRVNCFQGCGRCPAGPNRYGRGGPEKN